MNKPFNIKPGDILSHFKRHMCSNEEKKRNYFLYRVLCVAQHTETGEDMMVYEALYAPFSVYARPLSMVYEPVDKEKYPNVAQEYRFKVINKEET